MRSFQNIVFIWAETSGEFFKSALVYLSGATEPIGGSTFLKTWYH